MGDLGKVRCRFFCKYRPSTLDYSIPSWLFLYTSALFARLTQAMNGVNKLSDWLNSQCQCLYQVEDNSHVYLTLVVLPSSMMLIEF